MLSGYSNECISGLSYGSSAKTNVSSPDCGEVGSDWKMLSLASLEGHGETRAASRSSVLARTLMQCKLEVLIESRYYSPRERRLRLELGLLSGELFIVWVGFLPTLLLRLI